MYLSAEAGQAVVARMAESLAPGGYLFMGPAETLRGISHDFHLCHTHGTFYYQLRTNGASVARNSPLLPTKPAPGIRSQPESWVEMPAAESGGWDHSIRQATDRIRKLTHLPERPRETMRAVENRVSADLSTALELLREERFEQALSALQALPAEAQTSPEVQVLRAALLANRGDLAKAEDACSAVLKIDELNAGAYYVMALCREQADDRRTAMEHDLTAIYLDPSFAMPHLHLGLLAKRGGELDAAAHELTQASLLLAREEVARVLVYGGGFSRDALVELCRRELQGCRRPS
jgi:chemotaxis protein methyltransferase CheR